MISKGIKRIAPIQTLVIPATRAPLICRTEMTTMMTMATIHCMTQPGMPPMPSLIAGKKKPR